MKRIGILWVALTSLLACSSDDGSVDASTETPSSTGGRGGSGGGGAGGGGASGQSGASSGTSGQGGASGSSTAGSAGSAGSGAAGAGAAGAGAGAAGAAGGATGGQGGLSGGGGAAGASAGAAGGAGEGGGSAGASGAGGQGCLSGILCGAQGECCAEGDECVDGACLVACPSGVRCGATCCAAGDVCVADACATPGGDCLDDFDCKVNESCEVVLGKCLPQPPSQSACQVEKPLKPFAPVLKWSWTKAVAQPTYDQAISAPLVADLDGDGVPDVVVTTANNQSSTGTAPGFLRALDGLTGAEKWDATTDAMQMANRVETFFSPVIADLDGDGTREVVAMALSRELIAFNADGSVRWRSTNASGAKLTFLSIWASTLAVADMDADGLAEVVLGAAVLGHDGKLRSGQGRHNEGGVNYHANTDLRGVSSVIADLDGDGQQDVVTGKNAYRLDGSVLWTNAGPDGFTAMADFEQDGAAEVVVAASSQLFVREASTGKELAKIALPKPSPGSPVVADFDGDGSPEIGVQAVCSFSIFEYDKSGGLSLKWTKPLGQCSGFITATAFDFEGDGQVEVLVHDDCRINVLRGTNGDSVLTLPASHRTWTEFVSVVDVDNDQSADLLFSANDAVTPFMSYCQYKGEDKPRHGVFVYSDPDGAWMPTRRVWNQQSYHITNIKADGSLPKPEVASWGPQGYNNYRVSAQGKGAKNAPDLVVDLAALLSSCPTDHLLQATVKNKGSLGVPAGVTVRFFEGTAPNGVQVGEATTSMGLLPGQSQSLQVSIPVPSDEAKSYYVVVDAPGLTPECIEDNNTTAISGVFCGKL